MIKLISEEQTLPLRSVVLRNGLPLGQCVFPTDSVEGCFHLGCFIEDRLVTVATFLPEDYPELGKGGIRLRGMATDPGFAGQGHGASLVNFAIDELTSANAAYIWCNARSIATPFYTKLGFHVISDEFDIPGIGPHFNMIRMLDKP